MTTPTAINNFLLSFTAAIATAASLHMRQSASDATASAIWAHHAIENLSTPTYTTLRIYPGGGEPSVFSGMRVPQVKIQADTRGKDSKTTLAQAWLVHEALIDDNGQSRMGWTISGKRVSGAGAIETDTGVSWLVRLINFTGTPGIIGVDKDGAMATDNFIVDFERAA